MKVFLIIIFMVSGHNDQEFSRSEEMKDLSTCWEVVMKEAGNLLKERDKVGMLNLKVGCEIQLDPPV